MEYSQKAFSKFKGGEPRAAMAAVSAVTSGGSSSMSRKTRSLAVVLVLAALATGSVGALPLDSSGIAGRGDLLSVVWEWLVSVLENGASQPDDPTPSLDKEGPQLDPDGNH